MRRFILQKKLFTSLSPNPTRGQTLTNLDQNAETWSGRAVCVTADMVTVGDSNVQYYFIWNITVNFSTASLLS